MRLLFLIPSCPGPYRELERAQRETWLSTVEDPHQALFYESHDGPLRREGDRLLLPGEERLANLGRKTLGAFAFALANLDFDLVVRPNLGAYIDLRNLAVALRDHYERDDALYAGVEGKHTANLPARLRRRPRLLALYRRLRRSGLEVTSYASGSCYLLSRPLCEEVVEQASYWNHALVDDVALGALLARSGVVRQDANRMSLVDQSVAFPEGDPTIPLYHIRLRSPDRALDVARMYQLHMLLDRGS